MHTKYSSNLWWFNSIPSEMGMGHKVSNNRTELSPLFQPPPLHSLWVSTHRGLLSAAVAFRPRSEWTCQSRAPQSNPTSSCSKQSESYRGHNSSLSVFFQARHVWVCSEDSGLWTWMYTLTFINSHSFKDNDEVNKCSQDTEDNNAFLFLQDTFSLSGESKDRALYGEVCNDATSKFGFQ